MSASIKVGDVVQVMRGRRNRNPSSPPTRGKVLRVDRAANLVWIEGVNRRVKHLKKSPRHPQGGRLERESPVAISNVMLVTADGTPVRLARAVRGDDGTVTRRDAGSRRGADETVTRRDAGSRRGADETVTRRGGKE